MEKAVEIFKRNILPGEKIGVSVSGGSDSMSLLDLILHEKLTEKGDILVINFEHGIRGDESKNDSAFVEEFCKKNNLALYFAYADIPAAAKKSGRSIEHEARLFRKTEYNGLIARGEAKYILLAHNLEDNTETVLMHIFRGAGIKGLIGMSEHDGYIVRPLITTPKSEILGYLTRRNTAYVTDSTNEDTAYSRNYLRKEVLPNIRRRWENVDRAIAQLSKLAAEASVELGTATAVIDGDSALIHAESMTPYAVLSALSLLGITADIERKHVDSILGLKCKSSGVGVDLPHNIRAVREYESIRVYPSYELCADEIPLSLGKLIFDGKTIEITPCQYEVVPDVQRFDLDKLPATAIIRTRRIADEFTPCGGRHKLLSDYLTDKKIPVYKRDRLLLIASGSEIYAIIGMEISDKIKLESTGNNCAEIKV